MQDYHVIYRDGRPRELHFKPELVSTNNEDHYPALGDGLLSYFGISGWSYRDGELRCNIDAMEAEHYSPPGTRTPYGHPVGPERVSLYCQELVAQAQRQVTKLIDKALDYRSMFQFMLVHCKVSHFMVETEQRLEKLESGK